MSDEVERLEKRLEQVETLVQALTARVAVEGQVTEFLLSLLFFERGTTVEENIKKLLRSAQADAVEPLSDEAAVWWSDTAILIGPMREALLERVDKKTERLRQAGKIL